MFAVLQAFDARLSIGGDGVGFMEGNVISEMVQAFQLAWENEMWVGVHIDSLWEITSRPQDIGPIITV